MHRAHAHHVRRGQLTVAEGPVCANCTTKGKPTKIQLCGICGAYHSTHNFGRESAHCSEMARPPPSLEKFDLRRKIAPAGVSTPRSSGAFTPSSSMLKSRKVSSSKKNANSFSGDESAGSSGEENYAASIQNSPQADRALLRKCEKAARAATAAGGGGRAGRHAVGRTSTFDRADHSIMLLQRPAAALGPARSAGGMGPAPTR